MPRDIGKEVPKSRIAGQSKGGLSRRRFLIGAGALAAGAVGQWAGRQAYADQQEAARKTDQILDKVGGIFKGEEDHQSEVTVEVHQKPDLVSPEFKTIFPNLTEEEKALALEQVRKGKVVMLNNLTNEAIGRIAEREELIRSSAKRLGMSDEVANLLVGLVITESNGRVDALGEPDVGTGEQAKGLTQMMEAIAGKYGLTASDGEDDERFIPEKILPATAQELLEYYSKFGNWGLAFWSWHAGEPQVYEAVHTYILEKYGQDLKDIKVVPLDESSQAQAEATAEAQRRMSTYRAAIRDHNVTIYHLFSHPTIRQMFSGKRWNMTDEYVYRVVAGFEAYREEKGKLGLG